MKVKKTKSKLKATRKGMGNIGSKHGAPKGIPGKKKFSPKTYEKTRRMVFGINNVK